MAKTVLALRHVHFEDLGCFEKPLTDAGFAIRYCDMGLDDLSAMPEPDLQKTIEKNWLPCSEVVTPAAAGHLNHSAVAALQVAVNATAGTSLSVFVYKYDDAGAGGAIALHTGRALRICAAGTRSQTIR